MWRTDHCNVLSLYTVIINGSACSVIISDRLTENETCFGFCTLSICKRFLFRASWHKPIVPESPYITSILRHCFGKLRCLVTNAFLNASSEFLFCTSSFENQYRTSPYEKITSLFLKIQGFVFDTSMPNNLNVFNAVSYYILAPSGSPYSDVPTSTLCYRSLHRCQHISEDIHVPFRLTYRSGKYFQSQGDWSSIWFAMLGRKGSWSELRCRRKHLQIVTFFNPVHYKKSLVAITADSSGLCFSGLHT